MTKAVVKNREGSLKQTGNQARVDIVKIMVPALAVRLAWIFFGEWESGDSAWYVTVARNIAFHHVFSANADGLTPTAFRPPLYSAVIAVLWFGDSAPIYAVLLLQAILGTATVALVYLIARDQFGRGVAVLASVGMALAPMTNHFTAVILSETLFTFLLTLGVFLWGRKRNVSAGIVFGLAALARVTMLPFVVLLPLVTLLRPWRCKRRSFVTIMLLSLAIASTWMVRNAIVFHRFIPVASSGYGTNLLLGTQKTKDADDVTARKEFLRSVDASGGNAGSDESEADRLRLRAALQRIANNPGQWIVARAQQYPRLFIDSGSYMFGDGSTPFRTAVRERRVGQVIVRVAFIAGNILVFLFALVGMIAERQRFVTLSHITLFPILLCVISLPLWIEPRYGLPMMPLVSILAAAGLIRSRRFFARSLSE
jgi:4-amino-4-deoxy-L-arabinose transferase-like glycosyltransferase